MSLEMRRNNQKISVCMATYNGAKFVKSQLESILIQLKEDDELIISDDNSKDDTIKIIQSFNDERIKIFNNNFKSGPVGNFENAIQKATGDFIFLCDQDDIWLAHKVEQHVLMHENYDLVVSDAIVANEEKEVLFESFFKERKSKKGLLYNLKRNSYIGCCMSFNRKIAEASLPFPSDIHMHDWWIGLVAEVKGRVCFLEQPLMYYIRHNETATATLVKGLPFMVQLKNRSILLKNILYLLFFKIGKK